MSFPPNRLSLVEQNIGFACTDLQCSHGRAKTVALRWLASGGERTEITYQQLADESSRFANVLTGLGVRPQERCFLLLPQMPEIFFAFLGTLKAQAVVGTLFSHFGDQALLDRLGDSQARVLVTRRTLLKKLQRVRD